MREIPLSSGYVTIVDDCDEDLVRCHSWEAAKNRSGTVYAQYTRRTPGGLVSLRMHRLITGAPSGLLVDHRDGNGLNNRRNNLRICSALENTRNRIGYVGRKRLAGGHLGVTFNKRVRRWAASIHAGDRDENGEARRISLRTFTSPEDAARAYDSAALHYFGEFAALNFPDETPAAFVPSAYGFRRHGDDVVGARLTDEVVRLIRSSADTGPALSRAYGVSTTTVSLIRRRLAWKHVA